MNPLAVDPGFTILPMQIGTQENPVQILYMRIIEKCKSRARIMSWPGHRRPCHGRQPRAEAASGGCWSDRTIYRFQ